MITNETDFEMFLRKTPKKDIKYKMKIKDEIKSKYLSIQE